VKAEETCIGTDDCGYEEGRGVDLGTRSLPNTEVHGQALLLNPLFRTLGATLSHKSAEGLCPARLHV
jgi:hypothetical protein